MGGNIRVYGALTRTAAYIGVGIIKIESANNTDSLSVQYTPSFGELTGLRTRERENV